MRQKGQSILEYVVIVVVIVGLIYVAATTVFAPKSDKGLGKMIDKTSTAATTLTNNIGNLGNVTP